MRIAITGSGGFIGRPLCRWLEARGHTVLPLSFSERGRERERLLALAPDALVHLGWYVHPKEYLYSPQNTECLRRSLILMETAATTGLRFTGVGSCLEYGPGDAPHRDQQDQVAGQADPLRPQSLYAECKLALARAGPRLLGDRFAWARPFHLYGPGEHPDRLLPSLARRLRAGEPVQAGPQIRDWLHVGDVAAGIGTVLLSGASGCFNICSGEPRTVSAFAQVVADHLGRPDLIVPAGEGADRITGENGRLRALGWAPMYDFAGGIYDVLEGKV